MRSRSGISLQKSVTFSSATLGPAVKAIPVSDRRGALRSAAVPCRSSLDADPQTASHPVGRLETPEPEAWQTPKRHGTAALQSAPRLDPSPASRCDRESERGGGRRGELLPQRKP